ncbi:hypothetical protein [Acanthopleuribacter pedis]|uniref:Uncharacterized protein n=1 Tax=Acanthopleuribacter pedis TaxID=442870 RepID=A0A8J7QHC3_9BACT|nr:hypothetical protein [Acanthopleuribacter pedis]MBO1320456.1 hypothetical protein [Acanthopleuribacter pedis]
MVGRSIHDVLQDAIADGKVPERILLSFAILIGFTGMGVIYVGIYANPQIEVAALGTAMESLVLVAVNMVKNIRRENYSIRLLEIPLSKASTSEEAAKLLSTFFRDTWKKQ